jgi:peptide/nickel transport system substrate-binding protein
MAVLLVLLATALLGGCTRWPLADATSTSAPRPVGGTLNERPTATPEPRRFGGRLTVRLSEEVGTLNPLRAQGDQRWVTQLIFAGLMRLDPQLRPVPDLAESWTTSPDELTWTFKLRSGARWHDGTTLTSEDIFFTYRALLEGPLPVEQSGPAGIAVVAQADMQQVVEELETPDPYTVRLKLRRRFSPLLVDLTMPILPRHLLRDVPAPELWQREITVGAGPFRLRERPAPGTIILDAFPQYYRGRPDLDQVVFLVAADEGEVVQALLDGNLLLAEVSATAAAKLSEEEDLKIASYPDLTFYYVGFNVRPGRPLAEKALRQAWAYAVDKTKLIQATLGGDAEPVWSAVPPYSWASDETIPRPTRDLRKARELLEAAGWKGLDKEGIRSRDGQRLSVALLVRRDAPERIAVARALAAQLREVGIEVLVTPADFGSAMAAARRPPFDFDAMLMGWTMGEDPDDYYLFHSSQIPTAEQPSGYNYVGFRSDEFDRLSVEARAATDWRRRAELYRQIQHIIAAEQPYYFLWAERTHVAAHHRLIGLPEPLTPSFWSTISRWQLRKD